jgi:hypothetical protein
MSDHIRYSANPDVPRGFRGARWIQSGLNYALACATSGASARPHRRAGGWAWTVAAAPGRRVTQTDQKDGPVAARDPQHPPRLLLADDCE